MSTVDRNNESMMLPPTTDVVNSNRHSRSDRRRKSMPSPPVNNTSSSDGGGVRKNVLWFGWSTTLFFLFLASGRVFMGSTVLAAPSGGGVSSAWGRTISKATVGGAYFGDDDGGDNAAKKKEAIINHRSTVVSGYGSRRRRRQHQGGDDEREQLLLLKQENNYQWSLALSPRALGNERSSQNSTVVNDQKTTTTIQLSASECPNAVGGDLVVQWAQNTTDDEGKEVENDDREVGSKGSLSTEGTSIDGIPVVGLYGLYHLPSGIVLVWIQRAHTVYELPATTKTAAAGTNNPKGGGQPLPPPLWQIHKVSHLYVQHLPYNKTSTQQQRRAGSMASTEQRQEEKRQFALFRQALKDHDWYYSTGPLMPCITRNLQNTFRCHQQHHHQQQDMASGIELNHSSLDLADNDGKISRKAPNSSLFSEEEYPGEPDERFFWNQLPLESLRQSLLLNGDTKFEGASASSAAGLLLDLAVPITSASFGVQRYLTLGGTNSSKGVDNDSSASKLCYDHILLTRRSRLRAGTRFTRRGADSFGATANYAETEQVVLAFLEEGSGADGNVDTSNKKTSANKKTLPSKKARLLSKKGLRRLLSISSFVQTRGSIPLRWSSPADVRYRPRVRIGTNPIAQAAAMIQHLTDETARYVIHNDGDKGKDREKNQRRVMDDNDGVGSEIPSSKGATTRADQGSQKSASLILVNLIDKHSDQGRLGRALDSVLEACLDVYNTTGHYDGGDGKHSSPTIPIRFQFLKKDMIQHVWYDFHAETKKGAWHKLERLLEGLQPALLQHGYFCAVPSTTATAKIALDTHDPRSKNQEFSSNSSLPFDYPSAGFFVNKLQTGVVRTNCMDCLDRTNVVQSIFARYMLFQQLLSVHVKQTAIAMPKKFRTSFQQNSLELPWSVGETALRKLWADHADAISKLYAGTPALKGDFTRTGKRTRKGAVQDGMNSLQRYYLNNFIDADRQEGMDLMIGLQGFSCIHTDEINEEKGKGSVLTEEHKDMTLQEAARQLLSGTTSSWRERAPTGEDNDEAKRNYGDESSKSKIHPVSGGAMHYLLQQRRVNARQRRRSRLALLWLPGDLQTQVRSLALQLTEEDKKSKFSSLRAALEAMDYRSKLHGPWWADDSVIENSSSSDYAALDDEEESLSVVARVDDDSIEGATRQKNHPSYIVASILAVVQAPRALAAILLGLVAFGIFP